MTKREHKTSQGRTTSLVVLGLVVLGLVSAGLLRGKDVALFNPKGLMAQEQYSLMLFSVAVMLVIAVPTVGLLYFFAWKYRETNKKALYSPNIRHSKFFVASLWVVPSLFILVLASAMVPATYRLEPQKSAVPDDESITIQVVALRWKWLFIYPEHGVASVNFVQVPVDTPVRFELTADETPKSSFWIPHLGGQLYAMTGHVNPLYLLASEPGDYPGSSAEINGAGFAGMKFTARASSQADFDLWVQNVQQSPSILDSAEYEKLLIPSEKHSVELYSVGDSDLYAKMLMKYVGSHGHGSHSRQPAKYDTGH